VSVCVHACVYTDVTYHMHAIARLKTETAVIKARKWIFAHSVL